jgi:hypothetical protein
VFDSIVHTTCLDRPLFENWRHNLLDLVSWNDSLVAVEQMVCIVFIFVVVICVIIFILDSSHRESIPSLPEARFRFHAPQPPRECTCPQVLDRLMDSLARVPSPVEHNSRAALCLISVIFIIAVTKVQVDPVDDVKAMQMRSPSPLLLCSETNSCCSACLCSLAVPVKRWKFVPVSCFVSRVSTSLGFFVSSHVSCVLLLSRRVSRLLRFACTHSLFFSHLLCR